ncbi:hypothetical protein NX801_20395 [Streptomyces sp. LP05-1]|uniref:Mce-associated membrane protein n=1 Tax=Streptomyces pyxinae TaxID=2970734 RepID=A0ABT2CKM4_9ACTN|nr:hypothetical protein [Streptomyces sp. LP05-1]MCS0637971.1 hypothetical protein [Streptomyces sp. LP05-1]
MRRYGRPGRRSGPVGYGWWAALAVAAVCCGLAGWACARAAADPDRARARERADALAAGRLHLARLSSADPARPGAARAEWLDASAGPLRARLATAAPEARIPARATVTDAALTALDTRAGTATLIATVQVVLTPGTGRPTTDRRRLEAGLTRTPEGWRVSRLAAVPVAGTGGGPGGENGRTEPDREGGPE